MQTPDLGNAMINEQVEEYCQGSCKYRKTRNVEGFMKKQPQRGLGVAQLEKLRLQEEQQMKQHGFHFLQSVKLLEGVSSYPLILQKWPPNSIVVICPGDANNGSYSKFVAQPSESFLTTTSVVLIGSAPLVTSKGTRLESEGRKTSLRGRNHVYPAISECKNGLEIVQKVPLSPLKAMSNKNPFFEMKAIESSMEPVRDASRLLKIQNDSRFTGGSSKELSSFQNYPPNTPWREAEKKSQSVRKRSRDAVCENRRTDLPSSLALALSVAGHEDGRPLRDEIQQSNTSPMAFTSKKLLNLSRHIVYNPDCAESYSNGEDVGALMQNDFLSLSSAFSCVSDNGKTQKTENTFHDNHDTGNLRLDLSL